MTRALGEWEHKGKRRRALSDAETEQPENGLDVSNMHRELPYHAVHERRLAERYANREVAIHVHIRGKLRTRERIVPAPDFCAVFECASKNSRAEQFDGRWLSVKPLGGPPRCMCRPVFVDYFETFELAEKSRNVVGGSWEIPGHRGPYRRIRSIEWLQLGDTCLLTWAKQFDSSISAGQEGVGIRIDREHAASGILIGQIPPEVHDRKLIDEVIEGRSQIVDAVTRDVRPIGVTGLQPSHLEDVLACTRVIFNENCVLVQTLEMGDLLIQDSQVLLGPPQFPIASIHGWNGTTHAGTGYAANPDGAL